MKLMNEQTADSTVEKHVPVVEKTDDGYLVKVGSVPHPMEAQHYIEWIEISCCGQILRKYLKPGDPPEARFVTDLCDCEGLTAREYCNIHGLWKV